jgi:hypothetical protein
MPDDTTELRERFNIIESMIAEGRRSTESWGSTFVLWGVAYYVAIAWSRWGHTGWAWPATISIAAVLTIVLALSKTVGQARTTFGRAIGSIWTALGISMFLLFFALGLTGRLTDWHLFVAVISAILGMANGASALILRWRVQLACAVVWWATAVATCFANDTQSMIIFLVAIFLCQIVFGIYGMIANTQGRKRQAPLHA